MGVAEIETQTFETAVPVVKYTTLQARLANGSLTALRLYPLWPNLVRTCQTPPEGLVGPLIDIGKGKDADLAGKRIEGSMVVMDWDCKSEWLSVPEFGGKALLFRAKDKATGNDARIKFMSVPADIPRFYVHENDLAVLDKMLESNSEATIRCEMTWEKVPAQNLIARLPGPGLTDPQDPDTAPILFHSYYDSISVVPEIAPGAEQASSAATLLELARHFVEHPSHRRPVYVLFTGGHGQAMAGMTHFVRTLRDGLEEGWEGEVHDTLVARMGRPGLFVGLDLSSHSERIGVFCNGQARNYQERLLRPRFSILGFNLNKHANALTPDRDSAKELASFVDCINLHQGRHWWSYLPYRVGFESEIPTTAGLPGITLASLGDMRRRVDTPHDLPGKIDWNKFSRQVLAEPGKRIGLLGIARALVGWKGPLTNEEIDDKWARLSGRAVWLDPETNYTPDEPLVGACVALKTYRGDKYTLGTRGIPVMLSDAEGRFEFDGLIDITGNPEFKKCSIEAYGLSERKFVSRNGPALVEWERTAAKFGQAATAPEPDGSIIYAANQGRPEDQPTEMPLRGSEQSLNIQVFPCQALSLFGLSEPRSFLALSKMSLFDIATTSPPFQHGMSTSDTAQGTLDEICVTFWTEPSLQVGMTFDLPFRGKRLVLVNNSHENTRGKGFAMNELAGIHSIGLQGASDMWNLDEARLEKFRNHGIRSPRITRYHDEAREYLDQAEAAIAVGDYMEYRKASERGWSLEIKAYNELFALTNNMVKGVLFYLLLLVPFSYCLERLLFASVSIKKRLIGIGTIFSFSFLILVIIHPAFRFTPMPPLVLLAFLVVGLAGTVIVLITRHFDRLLFSQKSIALGIHEEGAGGGDTLSRSVDLGISNIRRRPVRCFLTSATIVLITFTLLSFTSVVPETGISQLQHPKGEPVYRGLLARHRSWQGLPLPLYHSLQRSFLDGGKPESATEAAVVARSWYFSDWEGSLSQIEIAPSPDSNEETSSTEMGGFFRAIALVGMEAAEPAITRLDKALVAGRWFREGEENAIILPLHAARFIGYGPEDVGNGVDLFGRRMSLVGLYDSEKMDAIKDLDGEPLMPVNLVLQRRIRALRESKEQPDTLEEYVHFSSDQVAIVPLAFTFQLATPIRSVAVKVGQDTDVEAEAKGYARRSNQTILASNGEEVRLYASLARNRVNATAEILFPVLLAFLMVLGTMLGSVYERKREIFIYNSVGLSPTDVSTLFVAEAAVYAILGAGFGYLIGQVLSRILLSTGLLPGLALNYSAGSTILVLSLTVFVVLLSAVYPARQAFRAALPRSRESDSEDTQLSGDQLGLFLPFVTDREGSYAMQSYLHEFLQGLSGISFGELAVDNLQAEDQEGPVLRFRAWLAPFDLGISHDGEIRTVYQPDRKVYQFHLTASRWSGDQQNWNRLVPRFLGSIRKQFLLWRVLSGEDHARYEKQAEVVFGYRPHA